MQDHPALLFFQSKNVVQLTSAAVPRFRACGTASDDNDIAGLFDFMLHIVFPTVYRRIDSAADGLVQADAVSTTADVAGNAAAKITFVSIFYLC